MSVRSRLERELRGPEAHLDAVLLERLRTPELADHRRYLCDVYGFLVPLERALAMSSGFTTAFLRPRMRSGLLATDLLAVGVTRTEYPLLARRFAVGPFTSRQESVAWMYVAERLVHAHHPVLGATGSRYLASYDPERWRELLARLDAYGFAPLARTHIFATIREATARLTAWAGAFPVVPHARDGSDRWHALT